MSGQDPKVRHLLSKIEESAAIIQNFIDGLDPDSFKADVKTQDAVMMRLIGIGELVYRLVDYQPSIIQQYPQIPWNMIRGMRNKIAHDYFNVDTQVLYDTAKKAIPELVGLITAIKQSD